MRFAYDIHLIAPIEVIEHAYSERKYIITKHEVFQICYSQAQQRFTAMILFITDKTLTGKEYEMLTGREVNERINHKLVVED